MTSCVSWHAMCQVVIEVLFVSIREWLCGPFESNTSTCVKRVLFQDLISLCDSGI